MGNVMVIPAKRQVGNTARMRDNEKPKLRVAAYCRVSTDSDEARLQVMKLRLSTTQNLFKRTRNGNLRAFMRMMVSPALTPRTVMNSTA